MSSKERRVTTKDIAEYAGVSQTTVSLVLNRKVEGGISPDTVRRVQEAAIKLGYIQPNAPGIMMSQDRQDIAFIIPDIVNPSFTSALAAASAYAYNSKVGLLVCNINRSNAIEREYIAQLVARGVGGILYACAPTCGDLLEKARRKIPVVVVGDTQQASKLPTVATDGYQGGAMIAKYLYGLGHRHIAYITPPINAVSIVRARRLAGIQETLAANGITDTFTVFEHTSHIASGSDIFEISMGQMQTERILSQRPEVTAIITQGDLIGIGAYNALRSAGLSVPEDMSVVGFDNIEYARFITPPLTTIDTKLNQRVEFAFTHLVQLMNGRTGKDDHPLFVDFRSTLIIRESAAKPRETPPPTQTP